MMSELVISIRTFLIEMPDWVWSALVSFVVAKVTLHLERKQTAKFRREDVKLQHLSKCMNWLNELQMEAYIVSDKGIDCLCAKDVKEFGKRYGEFNVKANEMMEKCLVGIPVYSTIAESLGINFDLEEIRGLTGKFTRDMRKASKDGLYCNEDAMSDLINASTKMYIEEVETRVVSVGRALAQLIDEK